MSEGHTIADAFPTLTSQQLTNILPGELSEVSPRTQLLRAEPRVFEDLARGLIAFRGDVALGASLPGLHVLQDQIVSEGLLSARPHNVFRRSIRDSGYTWGDISALSPNDLLSLRNFGLTSAIEVVAVCARRAVAALDDRDHPARDLSRAAHNDEDRRHATDVAPAIEKGNLPGLLTVAQWLQDRTDADTLEEGIAILSETDNLPEDVDRAWRDLRSTPLSRLVDSDAGATIDDLVAAIDGVLADERMRTVFWSRLAPAAPTLEELGNQLSLTRERVRQLQVKAEDNVRRFVARPDLALVRWRVHALHHGLGIGFSPGAKWADAVIEEALAGTSAANKDRVQSLMLWLAGPYRTDSNSWMSRAAIPGRAAVAEAVDESRRVNVAMVTHLLVAQGLVPDAVETWMSTYLPTIEIGGSRYVWTGSVADKAYVLLSAYGRPLTAEQLVTEIGEGHGVRSTRWRLLDDERFKRVDRHRIGLRHWDLDEYTGIVDEITQEIERRGGEADVRDLISTVSAEYDLRLASVESYTTVPRFVLEGQRVRVRRPDEPYQPRRSIVDEARCYVLDESRSSYRLLVDREVLRGSGRPIPEGLGVWLGVLPGMRRSFAFGEDEISVTWPDSALLGPSIGSLRRIVAGQGGEDGDQLLIIFDREHSRGRAVVIREADLRGAAPDEQIVMLTGVHAADRLEEALSVAVGATPDAGVKERLRRRGESEVLSLVARRTSQLDDALERLREVL